MDDRSLLFFGIMAVIVVATVVGQVLVARHNARKWKDIFEERDRRREARRKEQP